MLAGCVQTTSTTEPASSTHVELLTVTEDGLTPIQSIAGLTWTPEGVHWEVLDGLGNDRLRIVAFIAGETGKLRYEEERELNAPESNIQPPSEEDPGGGYCVVNGGKYDADLDFYIERASTGGGTGAADAGQYGWGHSSGTGGGRAEGRTAGTTKVKEGEALLFFGGFSGVPVQRLKDNDSSWTVDIEAPISRIIEFPAAALVCGFGFNALNGTFLIFPETNIGGSRTEAMLYGASFDFCPTTNPLDTVPTNYAEITMNDQWRPLGPASREHLRSNAKGAATLQLDQWTGQPFWMMIGMNVPNTLNLLC